MIGDLLASEVGIIDLVVLVTLAGLLIGHFISKRKRPNSDFTGGDFPQDHK